MPFAVLATEGPANGAHKAAAWLARDPAITALPAVSPLKALRDRKPKRSDRAADLGLGNSLLDVNQRLLQAKLAREKQSCLETA